MILSSWQLVFQRRSSHQFLWCPFIAWSEAPAISLCFFDGLILAWNSWCRKISNDRHKDHMIALVRLRLYLQPAEPFLNLSCNFFNKNLQRIKKSLGTSIQHCWRRLSTRRRTSGSTSLICWFSVQEGPSNIFPRNYLRVSASQLSQLLRGSIGLLICTSIFVVFCKLRLLHCDNS